ncbi:MAG: T9SS type A sorting domain-containing protein [Saprospiraceae bacterium]
MQKIGYLQSGFNDSLATDAFFGSAIANVGDINGDGITDIAAGALYQDSVSDQIFQRMGTFYLLFMNSDGTVKNTMNLGDSIIQTIYGTPDIFEYTGRFGYSIEGIGDINLDGIPDLAVGFPDYENSIHGKDAGGVMVLLMKRDGGILSHSFISDEEIPELKRDDRFGHAIASIGDLDGDQIPEFAISAPRHQTNQMDFHGSVWILSLRQDGSLKKSVEIPNTYSVTGTKYWAFGWALESIPDLNNDGIKELMVGTPHGQFDTEEKLGNVSILFLNEGFGVSNYNNINFYEGGLPLETVSNDSHFGEAIALLGDLEGDGSIEVAIGSSLDEMQGIQKGRIWILSLDAFGTTKSYSQIKADDLKEWSSFEDYERLGANLAALGDLDGDGKADLLASSRKPGGIGELNILFGVENILTRVVDDRQESGVVLYPNPAGSFLRLKGEKYSPSQDFEVYDSNGTLLLKGKVIEELDISNLSAGTYWLKIRSNENKTQVLPFLKS